MCVLRSRRIFQSVEPNLHWLVPDLGGDDCVGGL